MEFISSSAVQAYEWKIIISTNGKMFNKFYIGTSLFDLDVKRVIMLSERSVALRSIA